MSIDEMVRLLFEGHGVATVARDRGFMIPAAKLATETEFALGSGRICI